MRLEDFIEQAISLRAYVSDKAHPYDSTRAKFAEALKLLRCGYTPSWRSVYWGLQWMEQLARMLQFGAELEICILNKQRPHDQETPLYRKPRFYKKKAPPKPRSISPADQETFLEGVLRWFDAMAAATTSPPGECYPHLPPGLKAVLQRNGYDPHHHKSPRNLVKEYFG